LATIVFLEETFEISIELNIRNTVFNTNKEEFPLQIIYFILLFTLRREEEEEVCKYVSFIRFVYVNVFHSFSSPLCIVYFIVCLL
jgi:hypothetical protein